MAGSQARPEPPETLAEGASGHQGHPGVEFSSSDQGGNPVLPDVLAQIPAEPAQRLLSGFFGEGAEICQQIADLTTQR